MTQHIEIVSVKNGKFHRLANPEVGRDRKPWEPLEMACGLSLEPQNYFVNADDANRYTGGRLAKYICKHCESAHTRTNTAA